MVTLSVETVAGSARKSKTVLWSVYYSTAVRTNVKFATLQVRCIGALGFVLLSSWLLRDNILALVGILLVLFLRSSLFVL